MPRSQVTTPGERERWLSEYERIVSERGTAPERVRGAGVKRREGEEKGERSDGEGRTRPD